MRPGVTRRPAASMVRKAELGRDICIDRGDAVAGDGDVAPAAQASRIIDHLAAFDQQVKSHACSPWRPGAAGLPRRPAWHPLGEGARHQSDELRPVQIGASSIEHLAAEAEHDDAIDHTQDLLHVVADEDDGHAMLLQPLDEGQDDLGLLDAQCRRGLVQEDDPAAPDDGAGDGDGLALAPRQRCHLGPGAVAG